MTLEYEELSDQVRAMQAHLQMAEREESRRSQLMESMEKKSNILKRKGTATINLLTGDVNFSAYNEGGGTAQKNVVKAGDAKLYETEGEKQSSICAHLRVSSLVADPRAELQEQLDAVLRKAGYKEEPEGLLKPQVKCLERSKVLTIWHDKKKRKVVVQMVIDTEVNTTLEQPLYQLAQMTVKCFAINERSLNPRKK